MAASDAFLATFFSSHFAISAAALAQGLKLVHFSAQRKHVLWDTLVA
jgi:hypothetical protein